MRPCALVCVTLITFVALCPATPGEPAEQGPAAGSLVDVAFTASNDQSEQRYVIRLPSKSDPDKSVDLMVALHGHGADRWQFARDPRDECRAARDVAAKYGMIFVSPDYRARTSWMGPQAEEDLVQILADLKKRYRIERVVVSGGSMGGTSALTFAALHPELVDGVVSLNGHANHLEYDQFQDAISSSFGGPKLKNVEEFKKRSAEYWPERLTMPCAMTTGGRDTLVPPASCQRLAAVLTQLQRPVLLLNRPEGGHSTDYADSVRAFEFVMERLPERSKKTPN